MLRETQSEVDELQAQTESSAAERVVEVELLVANAQQEARVETEGILADATAEGEAVIARAKDEGRALLEQVQEARRRVLADLASRRRALGIQIEQLRAARDEMAASVLGVRDKVDGILGHLERTDEEARAAAAAVGDQFRLHGATEGPQDQDAPDGAAGEVPPAGAGPAPSEQESEGESGTDDGGASGAAPSVDELFARIRAGSVTGASPPGTTAGNAPVGTAMESAVVEGGADGGADRAEGGGAPAAEAAGVETAGAATAEAEAAEAEAAEAEAAPGPDDQIIARRDELLAPVTARLSRTVKRALGDDQNRLLDQLRSSTSRSGDELLGDEEEHVVVFASKARGHLAEAFTAGTVFAGAGAAAVPDGDAIEESSAALGARDRDHAAPPDRRGDRRAGRPGGGRVPRMAGRASGAPGGRLRHAGLLGGRGGGRRGGQDALDRDVHRRLLGLRGQRARGSGQRHRSVPDRPRPPSCPLGLPLSGGARGRRGLLTAGATRIPRRRAWPLGRR